MARGVDDGDVVLGGLKLPQRDVDGDATLTLSLQLVQHPGVFEGPLPHLANTEARTSEKPKLPPSRALPKLTQGQTCKGKIS